MKIEETDRIWKGVLVYIEAREGDIRDVSMELLAKACEIGACLGEPVYGIVAAENIEQYSDALKRVPIEQIYLYECPANQIAAHAEALSDCIRHCRPAIVLIGGTMEGHMIAPVVAVEFRSGVTADCTGLCITKSGELLQSRPAFGGNLMADILTKNRPQIATVRSGVFQKKIWGGTYPVELSYLKIAGRSKEIHNLYAREKSRTTDITEQGVLIAVGRGLQKKEDLEMIRECAVLLGGELASSRGLVEKGWMPARRQIGLSGQSVSPKLLLTVGISGTVQFAAGIKNAKKIIAINSDAHAQIFRVAHYPICGDLYDIMPKLVQRCINT